MYLTDDRALADESRRRIGAGYWPILLLWGGQRRVFVRAVTIGRDSVVRWSSRLFGRGVQVSPMSDTWLRTHEADYSKRGAEI
jgi:hypothetical protein